MAPDSRDSIKRPSDVGHQPTLTRGRRLGAYEIDELLGRGGMGEVYKARDSRLNRLVALKLLPVAAALDPERRERFEREARAVAALNHPHIVTIYSIESADGVTFLTMELVEGSPLAEMIPAAGLPLDPLLKIAIPIADAVAAAHQKGITHRDLKPANIMLGEGDQRSRVKVLDFGLAKLTETAAAGAAPETTLPMTGEGRILGTTPYMSPEQAQGQPLDARSDVFSMGVVLYEMATGQRPFRGDTSISIISSIVKDTPISVTQINPALPREFGRILGRALAKDPDRRYQTAKDLRNDLEELRASLDSPELPAAPVHRQYTLWFALTVSVLLAAAAAVAVVWYSNRPSELSRPVLNRLTSDSGLTIDPAVSPDGVLLAYASDRSGEGHLDIWVQQIAGGDPVRLTRHAADDREPSFSPDGTKIVFRSDREGGGIYLISALGGDARLIAREGRQPRFAPDGSRIAYWSGVLFGAVHLGTIQIVSASGGVPSNVNVPGASTAYHPLWSPDGRQVLFQAVPGPDPYTEPVDWWVTSPSGDGSQERPIRTGARDFLLNYGLSEATPTAWVAEDNQIIFSATAGDTTNLWQVSISPSTWRLTGVPKQLTFGAGVESQATLVAGPRGVRAADSPRVVFSIQNRNVDVWALSLDAATTPGVPLRRLTHDANADVSPAISKDGRTVVFTSGRSGNLDIWQKDLVSGLESPVTTTPSREAGAALTTDGRRVAYESGPVEARLCEVMALGSPSEGGVSSPAIPELLRQHCHRPWSWSSNDTKLLYSVVDRAAHNDRIGVLDVVSGNVRTLLQSSTHGVYQAYFSPDDRWVVFNAPRPTALVSRVFIAPFPSEGSADADSWIGVTNGSWDDKPRWSADGNRVYFTSDRDGFHCIWAQELNPVTKRPVKAAYAVYHAHGARLSIINAGIGDMDTSVGADTLVFPMGEITGNIWMATAQAPQ